MDEEEQRQIRMYEIIRGEEDIPNVAEAALDNDAPDWGGVGRTGINLLEENTPSQINTLLSNKREVAGSFDSPLFSSSHSYDKEDEVK